MQSSAQPFLHGFASRFRPFFFSAAAFSLVVNILMIAPALFMLQVFDRVLTSRSIETLTMLLALVVIALVFMAFLDMIRSRLLTAAAVTLEKRLGPEVLEEMIRRSVSPNEDKARSGLRDVHALRSFLTGPGILAIFDAPWVPIYVLIILLFHPLLGLLAILGALVLLALGLANQRLTHQPMEEMQVYGRLAGHFAEQSVVNAEVARALGMEAALARGWAALNQKGLSKQLQASYPGSALMGLTKFTRQFLQVVMLATGAYLVIDQQTTSGVMIGATILLSRALAPVESAIAGWKGMVEARSAYARLQEMFSAKPEGAVPETELPPPTGALNVDRVVFIFRGQDQPVIKQISFELAAGEALAIVGPSAAGKSTLARLLVGLWKPAVGAVRLDGADISNWTRERLGPYIGYLPQDVELFAGTVSQNIARMGEVDSAAVIDAARLAQVHELILHLPEGYDTPVGAGGAFLSAGQRQRVALARALYRSPRLVVLDEPNSNLDIDGEAALIEAIIRMKAAGTTLVVITHRAKLLASVDKILMLRDGMIEKFGLPAEVFAPVLQAKK